MINNTAKTAAKLQKENGLPKRQSPLILLKKSFPAQNKKTVQDIL